MNDTSAWAAAKMAELMARRSGSERMRMASDMFATARKLQIAGILQEEPNLSDAELRLRLLERTYRSDFTTEQWTWLLERWRERERARR